MPRYHRFARWPLLCLLASLAACGGGGGGGSAEAAVVLVSIALTPQSLALAPGASTALTVTGTYSDGSTQPLNASSQSFQSSNAAVIAVDSSGVVSVLAGASVGAQATITATDNASGLATPPAASTVVTVQRGGLAPPTQTSIEAATATAQGSPVCQAIQPFYWEIGDAVGALASGSPAAAGADAVVATTRFPIASASKWLYAIYAVQQRGSAAGVTAEDIQFLTFASGYTYMDDACDNPPGGADSINYCLTLPSSTPGKFYNSRNPDSIGVFFYNAGHEQNHAGQFRPEISDLDAAALGDAMAAGLGLPDIDLAFNQPLLAGGVIASAQDYAAVLQAVLGGKLVMRELLGAYPICAWRGPGCDAMQSPQFSRRWHYSLGHWVEDDVAQGDDGAFSSPGAFGFAPWIDADKRYYGVISRFAARGQGNQNGWDSEQCGHALRAAWASGVQQ